MPPALLACVSYKAAGGKRLRIFHCGRGSGATGAWGDSRQTCTDQAARNSHCSSSDHGPNQYSISGSHTCLRLLDSTEFCLSRNVSPVGDTLNLGIGLAANDET
jgi:hypothetical protein